MIQKQFAFRDELFYEFRTFDLLHNEILIFFKFRLFETKNTSVTFLISTQTFVTFIETRIKNDQFK